MRKILSFRPEVADSATAFEAMAQIYRFLEQEYEYEFTILTSPSDDYHDDQLNVVTIPESAVQLNRWKMAQFLPRVKPGWMLSSRIKSYFSEADGVLTLDPTTFPQGHLALQYAVESDIPVWFDAGRTTARPLLGLKWKLRQRQLVQHLGDVAGIIVTSPKAIERFREIGLYNDRIASKFTVMGHPVDVDKFYPNETTGSEADNIQIVSLGRLVPEKGVYYIFEALVPILDERNDVKWTIIGSGNMSSLLKQEAADRGVEESIDFKGTVPHEQVPQILRGSNIYISHAVDISRWEEFFGVANLEAMACGLPCVVTNSGSIPYVIREEGIAKMVSQRDTVAIRETITELIESSGQRERMGKRAKKFVEREYSVESIGEKFHMMLQRTLD